MSSIVVRDFRAKEAALLRSPEASQAALAWALGVPSERVIAGSPDHTRLG